MGMVDAAYRGFKKLEAPKWQDFAVERGEEISNMKAYVLSTGLSICASS